MKLLDDCDKSRAGKSRYYRGHCNSIYPRTNSYIARSRLFLEMCVAKGVSLTWLRTGSPDLGLLLFPSIAEWISHIAAKSGPASDAISLVRYRRGSKCLDG